MAVFEGVREILAEHLGVKPDAINLNSELEKDLGADSVDALEIASAVEEKFSVKLADDEMTKLGKVSDLVNLIETKASKG